MKINLVCPALLLIISSCDNTENTKPTRQSITESVYASGVVKSRNQYQAFTKVAGVVDQILVQAGDSVRPGQVLMRIRNDASRLNVDNSKLAADYAEFDANAGKLKEAEATIKLAKTKLKNDSLLWVRQRNLWSQGIGTQVALEQSELAYKNSLTYYQQVMLDYHDLQRILRFNSNQSKTNLRISTALAEDYLIRSVMNGKVYKLFPEKGELVNTLNPVAIIGEGNDFLVELKVDEYDIVRLRLGQRVILTMDSYKGQTFDARLENIEPLMNEESRSFLVTAVFITRPEVLYPNLSVQANIIIRTNENGLTIPRNYLIGDTLVILRGGVSRRVVVGVKDYQRAEIIEGIGPSDIIEKPSL